MSKIIKLNKGFEATVDDADFAALSKFSWYAHKSRTGFYAARDRRVGEEHLPRRIKMHRQLMGFPACEVDHKDGDKMNNCRGNLREATHAQNMANMGRRRNNTSGFKGVRFWKGKFQARLMVGGVRHEKSGFPTAEQAARCYDSWVSKLVGEFARRNFA